MVVIHLSPGGRKKAHVYKVLVATKGAKLTGRYIEKVGTFTPGRKGDDVDHLVLDRERFDFWVKQGAMPSETLAKIVKIHAMTPEQKKAHVEKAKAFRKKASAKAAKKAAAPADGAAAAPATT